MADLAERGCVARVGADRRNPHVVARCGNARLRAGSTCSSGAADGALWHTAWDSSAGWYGWDIGVGPLNSAPDAVWRGPNWLDVFMRGVDGQIWQMTWDGVSWIGPSRAAAPAAMSDDYGACSEGDGRCCLRRGWRPRPPGCGR